MPKESQIPQDVINHIKSFIPVETSKSLEVSLVLCVFVYYGLLRTY